MNNETPRAARKDRAAREQTRHRLLAHLERLLPDPGQAEAFRAAMEMPPAPSLRVNSLVPQARLLAASLAARACRGAPPHPDAGAPAAAEPPDALRWSADCGVVPVPWCPDGYMLPGCTVPLGQTLEYALGLFYSQGAAPMLAVEALAPEPGQRVLDLCAAPGGKATHIAACMANQGLLVANEPARQRVPALVGQLERCGVANAVVLKSLGQKLARYFHNFFDRVLLDAPCSGDGILCKSEAMLGYWSVGDARKRAEAQLGLLRAALHMLRLGGELVYSTCSLSTEENEEVLAALLRRQAHLVEILPVRATDEPPLPAAFAAQYPPALARCARLWPHLHRTEGAFVARLRKLAPTTWPQQDDRLAAESLSLAGEAGAGAASAGAGETAAAAPGALPAACAALQQQWGFAWPPLPGLAVRVDGDHLAVEPQQARALAACPAFVRAGLHVAGLHRQRAYLAHAAVTLWGAHMAGPRLALSWELTRQFFRSAATRLPAPSALRGEVLVTSGPWVVARAVVDEEGSVVRSMLPPARRSNSLTRLLAYPD